MLDNLYDQSMSLAKRLSKPTSSLSIPRSENMDSGNQPLLSNTEEEEAHDQLQNHAKRNSFTSSSLIAEGDTEPIKGVRDFFKAFLVESKKVWFLIGPAVFTSICRYSLGAITQTFAGHVGDIELAAFAIENSVIAGFSFGLLLGMGSALETLCGQAYGAGRIEMLGVYLQRSWVVLNSTAGVLTFFYVFSKQFLKLIKEDTEIANAAGTFAIWMIPQLYAYAVYFPTVKFLQSQSKMLVMALIAGIALIFHTLFSWLLMLKMGWGLVGGAIVLNASWWLIVVAQLAYIFSGAVGRAWSGFSWKAFDGVWSFVRLSIASAIMLCLEVWYFMILILFAGYLKNAKISVDGLAVCMNILGWTLTVALGCNAATSIRVSNELGAGHPRTAKFVVVVSVIASSTIGIIVALILLIARSQYPSWFTSTVAVQKVVYDLTPLLATSIIINTIQPVLSGVAIGAGWQALVAYVNIGCYYIFGIPLGLILGFVAHLGVTGIWGAMLTGTAVQTCILFWMTFKTNWNKEASISESRIRKWGGQNEEDQFNGVDDERPTLP